MNDLKEIENYIPEYQDGWKNILVRTWTYIRTGLNQVNDYKYVAAGIFGFYYTLKLDNPLWLGILFIVSLPLLAYSGRWWLLKGAKTSEFVNTKKGSVLGYGPYNAQIRTMNLLEEILKELQKK